MSYDKNNVFAKIIRDEIFANKVYEDDKVLAFHDIMKAAPTHVLVIPKGEFKNFSDFVSQSSSQDVASFFKKVDDIAKSLKVDKSGFRLITNIGEDAHQTIEHFHVHILAGQKMGPLISSDNVLR